LADVRVIRALYRSADTGQPVALPPFSKEDRPSLAQEIRRPAVRKPALVNTEAPTE
jgi:glucose-fructose oxidoreductase